MQRAPLAHDFGERARVGQLVCGNARAFVTGDVADAVAAGLNAMHVDAGQQVHHVGGLVEWNPVVLHVLACGEVRIALGQAAVYRRAFGDWHGTELVLRGLCAFDQRCVRLVVVAGDGGEHAQLRARQLAVRYRHAQHRRVALHVPAVLQAQRTKLVFGQLPGLPARELVTVLVGSGLDELAVEFGVLVHGVEEGECSWMRKGGDYMEMSLAPA